MASLAVGSPRLASQSPLPLDTRRNKTADDKAYLRLVGDRVRAARDRLGLTRKGLSLSSGVSERYLADLEAGAGNASLMVLRRVATALQFEIEDLLSAKPSASPDLRAAVVLLGAMQPLALSRARHWLEIGSSAVPREIGGRIALIGLRGAGKSTLGRALADRLEVPFIELDREIERAAGMELSEIFALQGKAAYRQHELHCLEAVIRQHERAVIATGGSLVTEPVAYDLLLQSCHVIWLKADPESHMTRVTAQGDLRPMSGNPQAMDDLRAILATREGLYGRAHATIDTTGVACEEALEQILAVAPAAAG